MRKTIMCFLLLLPFASLNGWPLQKKASIADQRWAGNNFHRLRPTNPAERARIGRTRVFRTASRVKLNTTGLQEIRTNSSAAHKEFRKPVARRKVLRKPASRTTRSPVRKMIEFSFRTKIMMVNFRAE